MGKNINISGGTVGVLNVAEYMSNVTNTVNQNLASAASAPDDVKALVAQLAKEVEAAAPEVDAEQAQEMGKNLEALSKEVASPKPKRAWYEVSLEGLKEAAEAVGEIGKPIAATVAKLMPLLLGG